MTFAVVTKENQQERVIGTIWAPAEAEAQRIASDLWGDLRPQEQFHVRKAEEREIPLKLHA